MLSSLICSADGEGVGVGEGGGVVDWWVFEAEQGSQIQSLFIRYCAAFLRVRNISHAPIQKSGAPVAYSSTGDLLGTYRAGILGSRPWIRMYVARHQKEQ